MEELKRLVEKLEKSNENKERIRFLQKMGTKLINEYEIKVGTLTIQPLLVEAYYYHKEKFPDIAVHAAKTSGEIAANAHKRQQKNLGKLYVHCPKGSGLDICVTDSDEYYLSFLIKNALVNGQWKTQFSIAEALCGPCNQCKNVAECKYNDSVVLHKKDSPKNSKIIYLPRKGIVGDFACAPLAALPLDQILNYEFTLPDGYKKQWRTAVYALAKTENMNREMAKEIIKKEGLYSPIEEKYWMLAEETLKKCLKE